MLVTYPLVDDAGPMFNCYLDDLFGVARERGTESNWRRCFRLWSSGVTRESDYGDMVPPETPEADDVDDDLLDKYLNTELIFDVGTSQGGI